MYCGCWPRSGWPRQPSARAAAATAGDLAHAEKRATTIEEPRWRAQAMISIGRVLPQDATETRRLIGKAETAIGAITYLYEWTAAQVN
jgi:hypothetical protein